MKYLGIIEGIKNLIKWFPVIWKDREFDYRYLYEVMYFKLRDMEKFFNSDDTFSEDAKVYAGEIKECADLLLTIKNEETSDKYWNEEIGFNLPIEDLDKIEQEEIDRFFALMAKRICWWWD